MQQKNKQIKNLLFLLLINGLYSNCLMKPCSSAFDLLMTHPRLISAPSTLLFHSSFMTFHLETDRKQVLQSSCLFPLFKNRCIETFLEDACEIFCKCSESERRRKKKGGQRSSFYLLESEKGERKRSRERWGNRGRKGQSRFNFEDLCSRRKLGRRSRHEKPNWRQKGEKVTARRETRRSDRRVGAADP